MTRTDLRTAYEANEALFAAAQAPRVTADWSAPAPRRARPVAKRSLFARLFGL